MDKEFFDQEVDKALEVVQRGGIILYPTDTVWGLGCDATNAEAIKRIYQIKERSDSKSLIILVADERDILHYVASPDPAVFNFIENQEKPTTVIFENAIHLPDVLIGSEGTIAIRVVKDAFCRHLIKRLKKPLVSTSANISGQPSAASFKDISPLIKSRVDELIKWRQDEISQALPSRIVKWNRDGSHTIIRY